MTGSNEPPSEERIKYEKHPPHGTSEWDAWLAEWRRQKQRDRDEAPTRSTPDEKERGRRMAEENRHDILTVKWLSRLCQRKPGSERLQ